MNSANGSPQLPNSSRNKSTNSSGPRLIPQQLDGNLAVPPRILEWHEDPEQLFSAAFTLLPATEAAPDRSFAPSDQPSPCTFQQLLAYLLIYQDQIKIQVWNFPRIQYEQVVGHGKIMTLVIQPGMGEDRQASEARVEGQKVDEAIIERALDLIFAHPVQLVLDLLDRMTVEQIDGVMEKIKEI
ncbi:MAG: hypothetical protein LQ351_006798 [Letrouitia transgressa]|nr:MAG: hypothetical protein LQ351_006798 [Letrouitia transgressa]